MDNRRSRHEAFVKAEHCCLISGRSPADLALDADFRGLPSFDGERSLQSHWHLTSSIMPLSAIRSVAKGRVRTIMFLYTKFSYEAARACSPRILCASGLDEVVHLHGHIGPSKLVFQAGLDLS
jgi:hypothetical protein